MHRIGTDDYWYLHNPRIDRLAIREDEQLKRQRALIHAIAYFIASPGGAKTAAWAPHVFLTEGVVLLSSARTAPFVSPIKVDLSDESGPVKPNPEYIQVTEKLKDDRTSVWKFPDSGSLLKLLEQIEARLSNDDGKSA